MGTTNDHWLNADRVQNHPRLITVAYIAVIAVWIVSFRDELAEVGQGTGYDFLAFWSVSLLTWAGNALAAYDLDTLIELERSIVPAAGIRPWFYPPTAYPLVLPLAGLPYLVSFVLWDALSLLLLAVVLWKIIPTRHTVWVLFSTPLLLRVLVTGQNSLISASLLGLFVLFLDRRPVLAGICLGLLSYKPQLGPLIIFAVIAGREWKVLWSAAAATAGLALLGTGICGFQCWPAFFDALDSANNTMHIPDFRRWQPTVFAALREAGAEQTLAFVVHFAVAGATAVAVSLLWWRRVSAPLRVAALLAGTALISPFFPVYDLMILAPAVALLTREGLAHGWLKGEREVMFFSWLFPLASVPIAEFTSIQAGFLVPLALLFVTLRRALVAETTEGRPAPSQETSLRPAKELSAE